jgi:cell pole-organizing protein PopZ
VPRLRRPSGRLISTGLTSAGTASSTAGTARASPSPPPRAGRTIEEVELEALEPMLRAWLDRHLREIVERRVQEEIDRISRKSES